MNTQELCAIITSLGGDPESLADKTEKTLMNEIFRLIGSRVPTAAEVLTAIQGMSAEQKAAVKTALEIS